MKLEFERLEVLTIFTQKQIFNGSDTIKTISSGLSGSASTNPCRVKTKSSKESVREQSGWTIGVVSVDTTIC